MKLRNSAAIVSKYSWEIAKNSYTKKSTYEMPYM